VLPFASNFIGCPGGDPSAAARALPPSALPASTRPTSLLLSPRYLFLPLLPLLCTPFTSSVLIA
jgi:hypothetical protein